MAEFAVIILPVLIAVIVFFAPAPEAGKTFGLRVKIAVALLCALTFASAWKLHRDDARERSELRKQLKDLRTVSALRKETADLSKELLDFYQVRERYNDRFKPGQGLIAQEAAGALRWYAETVSLYHSRFEARTLSILEQVRIATGIDVSGLETDAKSVKFAPGVKEVATRLSALAASLP